MIPITTLLIGDFHRAEFREARDAICAQSIVSAVANVDRAASLLASGDLFPDVIVIAQARPGEFSSDEVDRLRRLAPLARVLGLLGSCCEGEERSGKPWPGVTRTYWYDWLPQWKQELERVRQGTCPAWGLPVTATGAEQLLHALERPIEQRHGLIAVCAPYLESYEALADACQARGYSTVWVRADSAISRVDGATAAIWDAGDSNRREIDQLGRLCDMLGGPPVVALMDFPRIDACRRVLEAGASWVVAKPFLLDDLFDRLDHVVRLAAESGELEAPAQPAPVVTRRTKDVA